MIARRWMFAGLLGAVTLGCGSTVEGADDLGESAGAIKKGPTCSLPTPVDLIAIGTLSGNQSDRSTATAAPLENTLAGNLLGGLGSGIAHADGCNFVAVPDRGPNATPYNSAVDDTTSYVPRIQTLHLGLTPNVSGASLPFKLTPTLTGTTLLFSKDPLVYGAGTDVGLAAGAPTINTKRESYFSGRSDNFDPAQLSTSPNDGRLDPESIRVSKNGKSVFISDEYGPFVYQFQRDTGRRKKVFALPQEFAISHCSPQGALEISGNTSGRVSNKGMEGLAISPDGKTLFGAMQSPLLQDGGTNGRFTRIVAIDIGSGSVRQFAYELTNIGTATKPKYPTVSDILAVNDHEFLVDERDGKGLGDDSAAVFKQVFHIDLTGAADVSGLFGEANLTGKAVAKTLFLDIVATLKGHGIRSEDIPAKLEGLAFGDDIKIGCATAHTLYVANDNDFIGTVTDTNHPAGIDNPNQFFVFAVDGASLPMYVAQKLNPNDSDD